MTPHPFLSIVIPAHNEEKRLPPSLWAIKEFLAAQPYPAEVLIIENGSRDQTLDVARSFMEHLPGLRVFQVDTRGKGLAVRYGMLQARGEYRFICDADLSMPVEQMNRFLPPTLEQPDVAIASREIAGAVRYHEPEYRHIIGRVFNSIVRWLALPGLQDTQCGFKCFSAEVVERVFPLQTQTGWAFDVEVLYIARRMGYAITEVPIHWYYNPDSRVRLAQDSLRMALDLLTIRRNARQGRYDAPLQLR